MVTSNSDTITIREVLHGLEVGRLQSVGLMQVIPLTCDDSDLYDENIISPEDRSRGEGKGPTTGTIDYGRMEFHNPDPEKTLLVPTHVGYVTKQAAQDHAMMKAGLVGSKQTKIFDDAACIQQSQGGTISKGQHEMLVLPYSLREAALAKSGTSEYSKIWPEISEFNKSLGITNRTGGHLEFFLDAFKEELDQFIAEFETVPYQIGAIVLINGSVVGVERAPSPKYWMDLWRPLVRECYGSLAIEVSRKTGNRIPAPKTRVNLRKKRISDLDSLDKELKLANSKEDKSVREIVRKLLEDPFSVSSDEGLNGYKTLTLKNDQFNGQVLRKSRKIVYSSLFTTKAWAQDAPWHQARKFSI